MVNKDYFAESELANLDENFIRNFEKLHLELIAGFNLLLHGIGEKKMLLNNFFKSDYLQSYFKLAINGSHEEVSIKSILMEIAKYLKKIAPNDYKIPINKAPLVLFQSISEFLTLKYAKTKISDFFDLKETKNENLSTEICLIVFIWKIDSPNLIGSESVNILSLLANCPGIRIVATVLSPKVDYLYNSTKLNNYNWIFYEISTIKKDSLPQTPKTLENNEQNISGLKYITKSLTDRKSRILQIIAKLYFKSALKHGLKQAAVSYKKIFSKVKDSMLLNSDVVLRRFLNDLERFKVVERGFKDGENIWRVTFTKEEFEEIYDSD